MRKISIAEFHAEIKQQGVTARHHIAFKCPMCRTIQSGQDFIHAGPGKTFDDVEKYVGFSCIGRLTNAGTPTKDNYGKGCNWTLGGLFQLHQLEVIDEKGRSHPRFCLATPEEAQAHEASHAAREEA